MPVLEEISEENMVGIELKFSAPMAHAVYDSFYEKDICRDSDGYFLVKAQLPDNVWLYSFILSFGEFVEVIGPEDVREKVKEYIGRIKKVYD